MDRQLRALGMSQEPCRRLMQIEGVGPLIATAIIAAISDPATFKNGRQLAAWLGLVPANIPAAIRNDCSALVNEEIVICARC
ncbi:MAG: transposase [Nitrospirales bacterium]|nr:transposase [Nitrospirales bacterium]